MESSCCFWHLANQDTCSLDKPGPSPNFSQAACRLQQATLQTQCILWQACFPAKNRLGDQSLGSAPNSATVGWAGSALEYIGIKNQFVVRRKKKKRTGKILNCYKTTTRKTSCLYLNREKRPDTSLAEEDIKHAGSSGRLSKLTWPVGWRQQRAQGVLPASLGKGAFTEQCSLPCEWHHGPNLRREGAEWTVPGIVRSCL